MMNERIYEMISGMRTPSINYYEPEYIYKHPELRGFFCNQISGRTKPRISYGVAIRDLTMDKWCCVAPGATIEFRILLEGNYIPAELPLIISQLYDGELRDIKEPICFEAFKTICRRVLFRDVSELCYAIYHNHMQTITMIANNAYEERKMHSVYADVCQLGFPKGRGGPNEIPLDSAFRELREETGIHVVLDKGRQLDEWFWESVHVKIGDAIHNGILFREPVIHTHVDMSGKAFKTFVWMIHTRLPKDVTDVDLAIANITTPHEVSSVGWHPSIFCSRFSRVKELFHKVWITSEDIKNITVIE
jgi:hypothetical protein